MLKVKNLTHSYGPHKAIDGLDFHIRPGTIAGFLGPNGAGKSTTMNIICGATLGYEGEVWVDGINLKSDPLAAKKKIGYLPENPPLYDDMLVREYLQFVAELKNVEKSQIASSVDEILASLSLEDVQFRPIYKLSKGFRQRVALAQAFVAKPDLIVLDEPTVGLDPQQINEFRKLIVKCKGRSTILWSTHILADVESTCDDIVVISKGKIIASGSQAHLREKMKSKASARFFVKQKNTQFENAIHSLPGVSAIQWSAEELCYSMDYFDDMNMDLLLKVAVQNDLQIQKMDQNSMDLEGLFLELTKSPKDVL